MLPPHGGILIQRMKQKREREELLKKTQQMKKIKLSPWSLSDLELLSNGAFSPLTGFMNEEDYLNVLTKMRLKSGIVWPIPITLPISTDEAKHLRIGEEICLTDYNGEVYGVLYLEDIYKYDKKQEAKYVFGTTNETHPGVQKTFTKEDIYLGGPVHLLNRPSHHPFESYYKDPLETRRLFSKLGWTKVVGFQTRNPIHRAHEYIQKTALETVDGLLLHPLVGETKSDDIPSEIRMKSYEELLDNYYPKDRVELVILTAAMRYAGPREAVFHALIRKNFGCSHFIIGRDHAGVGDFYGTYDGQKIFNQFTPEEIGIEIMKFEHAFYCKICENMSTSKTCPHDKKHHLHLSGTKVREMLRNGQNPPKEFTRPEIAEILIKGMNKR